MNLPEDVLDTIYKYKHQFEMSNVFDELTQLRINCRFFIFVEFHENIKIFIT